MYTTVGCSCHLVQQSLLYNFSHLLITAMQSRKRQREPDSDVDGTEVYHCYKLCMLVKIYKI